MSGKCACNKEPKCRCKSDKELKSVCEETENRNWSACDSHYLDPISYDDLFDEKSNKCTDYNLLIKKLEYARNAYFGFHTAICNFVADCTKLKQKARDDISGNDLIALNFDYRTLIQNLITSVALGMRKRIKDDNTVLVNFEVPETRPNKTIEHAQALWPTDIIFTDIGNVDTLVASLPSVTLYVCSNHQLQVKITSPKSLSYSNIAFDSTYIKTHRSAESDIFIEDMTPSLEYLTNNQYGFKNAEHANEVLDDIINYSTDPNIITHKLKVVAERVNSIITYIENSHKIIVQKIKTEKITQEKKLAKRQNN